MGRNESGGYECPACGCQTTTVGRTLSFPRYIERRRECDTCGYVHETIEMHVDMRKMLEHAHAVAVCEPPVQAPKADGTGA